MSSDERRGRLAEVAAVFVKLGVIGFGGPAAHIAMMEDEVVRRRAWVSREDFLDLVGACNLIPGPSSTELAIHLGHRRAGWPGLVVGGLGFIVPAALIVLAAAWAYVEYGALPAVAGVMAGIKPVILAIVVHALWKLGRTAVKTVYLAAIGAAALAAVLLGVHELLVLAAAGFLGAARRLGPRTGAWFAFAIPGGAAVSHVDFGLAPLFLFFAKVGSVLFGSGYVLLAFLRADLVERYGWLTESQLLDAIAVGQVTPGPVFTTATFIGYVLGGPVAAAVATAGIFLPAFVFVALSGPLIPRLRASPIAGAALDGINVASLALMAAVSIELARAAVVDVPTAVLAVAALAVLVWNRISSVWLVVAGGAFGAASTLLAA